MNKDLKYKESEIAVPSGCFSFNRKPELFAGMTATYF
jgi:hypothetical protein